MHEWHTRESRNIQSLINNFLDYEYNTDYSGHQTIRNVRVTERMFKDKDSALTYVTDTSYGGSTAYIAAYGSGKITKAYQNAFSSYLEKKKDYDEFNKNLTIAYGRKASKVTCPHCSSSINLAYGKYYKSCPICGSTKIISDSNWKILETKKRLVTKASEHLSAEAEKCGITFICGFEWHS